MHFLLRQKDPMKILILTLLSVLMKICQMPHVIFQTTSQFFLQILQESSVSWNVTPLYFFKSNVVYFEQKAQSKCKFFRLSSALIKIHQILVLFETKNNFFFKFCTTLWHHETYFLHTFFSWNFIYFQQKYPIKVQIWWNFTWAV